MKRTKKQVELISLYEEMARDGYQRVDGRFVENAYSDFELVNFRKPVKEFLQGHEIATVLDYGCGGSNWTNMFVFDEMCATDYFDLDEAFRYEPARDIDERREVDAVFCFDVLEHIFILDVPATLDDIFKYAKKAVVMNVACYPASALLPTGENAHITIRPPMWWAGMVQSVAVNYPKIEALLFCSIAYTKSRKIVIEAAEKSLNREGFAR